MARKVPTSMLPSSDLFLEKANLLPPSKQQVETQGLSERKYSRQRAFTEETKLSQ